VRWALGRGKLGIVNTSEWANSLMLSSSRELRQRARRIRLPLMDVDGVMTEERIYYMPHYCARAYSPKLSGRISLLNSLQSTPSISADLMSSRISGDARASVAQTSIIWMILTTSSRYTLAVRVFVSRCAWIPDLSSRSWLSVATQISSMTRFFIVKRAVYTGKRKRLGTIAYLQTDPRPNLHQPVAEQSAHIPILCTRQMLAVSLAA
jgi:hypothetical protein